MLFKKIILFILLSTLLPLAHAESNEAMQQDILKYINEYRVAHKLQPLQLMPAISKEAAVHSQDMATHRIPFGHKYFATRIKHLYAAIPGCYAGAENVAFNYKTPKILVQEWVKSPGHRRNIRGNYNLTGIGIAYDTKGKPYYTQLFIKTA